MDTQKINLESYQGALGLHEQLKTEFPNCFFPLGKERPLKVGIYQDLVKLKKFNKKEQKQTLKTFLMLYTSSAFYRAALLMPGATRVDLQGNEAGEVSLKARYVAKTHCRQIFWELDKEGYEQKKEQIKKWKKSGKDTIELMARLFPVVEKPKKAPPPQKPKTPTPPPAPKKKPAAKKAKKSVPPVKAVVVIKKKKTWSKET